MPKFLIKQPSNKKSIFEFTTDFTIGRGNDCELILPNPNISRHHASIFIVDDGVLIEDQSSQNGIICNGKRLSKEVRHLLQSQVEIQIGPFNLVFLSDSTEDQFYRGKSISYLPEYDPLQNTENDPETLRLSTKESTKMMREQSILNNACITSADGRTFYPEGNPMHFGGKGSQIKVEGLFTGGIVATIHWNGNAHVIEKKGSFLSKVLVNSSSISKRELVINDTITIGRSIFRYTLEK